MTIFDQHTISALHTNNKEKSLYEVGNFKLLNNDQKMKKIKNFPKILKMYKKCYKSRVLSSKSDKNSLFYDKMPNFKKSTAPALWPYCSVGETSLKIKINEKKIIVH